MKRQHVPPQPAPSETDVFPKRRDRLYSNATPLDSTPCGPNLSQDLYISDLHEFLFKNNCLPDFKIASYHWCRHTTAGLMNYLIKIGYVTHNQLNRGRTTVPMSDEGFEKYLTESCLGQAPKIKLDFTTTTGLQRWLNSLQLWFGDFNGIIDPTLIFAFNRLLEREVHGDDGKTKKKPSEAAPVPPRPQHQRTAQFVGTTADTDPKPNAPNAPNAYDSYSGLLLGNKQFSEGVYGVSGAGGMMGTVYYPGLPDYGNQERLQQQWQSSFGSHNPAPMGLMVQQKSNERQEKQKASEHRYPQPLPPQPVPVPPLSPPSSAANPPPQPEPEPAPTQSLVFIWDNVSNYITAGDVARFSCTSKAMCEAMFKLTPPAPKPPVLTPPAPKPPVEIVALVLDTKDNALDDGDSWLDDVNFDLDKDGGFMLGGVDGDQVDSTWSPLCEGDFPSGGSSSEDHERVNDQK